MFDKLRLKLTLINATIIFVLFVLLIAGTYLFSQRGAIHHSARLAHKIMNDLKTEMLTDLPPRPNDAPGPTFFMVKTDENGTITFTSDNLPIPGDSLHELAKTALQSSQADGTIMLDNTKYPYLKSPSDTDPATTIILFQDFTHEDGMLRIQLTALIVTGLLCLALSFYGSFFMANRAMAPIQTAWQQQIDFLSDASHELRTPLAVIQTNLDIVMGSPQDTVASHLKWLENIQEESSQMATLVDSLLFLARSDTHQQLLSKQTFSLNDAIASATQPFEPVAAAKSLLFSVTMAAAVTGTGDEARIKQVLSILIDNAIRHTPTGGRITVNLAKLNGQSLLTVADTGEGIDPTNIDKIFDRFFQVDKSRSGGGVGLGLAIAKCIIEGHGGKITVDSTPGFGTTFDVYLPW